MAEWEEYDRLEPFGQPRGDMQAGIVANAVLRAFGGGKGPDPRAFSIDAMIEKDLGPADDEEARTLAERQLEQFKAFAERSKKEKELRERGVTQQRVLVPRGEKPAGRVIAPRRKGR